MDQQSHDQDHNEEPAQVVVESSPRLRRLGRLARQHPRLSVLGAAGIALFGGVEIAVAVLIGAGVAALVHAGEASAEPTNGVRERARSMVDRAPQLVRERARAVVQAARGKIAPIDGDNRAPEAR